MVKKTAKKAAPVRKKAVAKKAAPVRKKAVAKKAAPARKKAVAKKAAPARKKAVVKKAVAKKAAPARKKAVAKKTVAAKKTTSTKTIVLPTSVPKESTSTTALWRESETVLPAFLQSSSVEAQREIVQTQAYVKKKSKPVLLWPIVSFSTLAIISFAAFSTGAIDKGSLEKSDSVRVAEKPSQVETAEPIPSPSEAADSKQSPSPKPSTKIAKKAVSNTNEFAPQSFAGVATGEEISFGWKSPVSTSRIVGFELLTRPVGSQSWVAISSVTVEQMSITVELDSMLSTSEYRIASILDNGKSIYNPLILSFVGVVG